MHSREGSKRYTEYALPPFRALGAGAGFLGSPKYSSVFTRTRYLLCLFCYSDFPTKYNNSRDLFYPTARSTRDIIIYMSSFSDARQAVVIAVDGKYRTLY